MIDGFWSSYKPNYLLQGYNGEKWEERHFQQNDLIVFMSVECLTGRMGLVSRLFIYYFSYWSVNDLHTDRLKIQTLSYLSHLQRATQNSIYHENGQDFLSPEMTSHHHQTCTRTLINLYACSLLIKVSIFQDWYPYQKLASCPEVIDYIRLFKSTGIIYSLYNI
jgi:hypothetical protein